MKIDPKEIAVRDLAKGYLDNGDDGVVGVRCSLAH